METGTSEYMTENEEPKGVWTPTEKEREELNYTERRILDMVNATNPFHDSWDTYEEMYHEAEDPNKTIGNNQINFRTGFTQVQAKTAIERERKLALTFEQRGEGSKDEVTLFKAVWDEEWRYSDSDLVNKDALLVKNQYGTAVIFDGWRVDKRTVWDPTEIDADGKMKYTEREIVDYDGVDTRVVDIRHWFPNEYSRDIRKMPDCCERQVVGYDEFCAEYQNNNKYKNTEYVPAAS